MTKKQNWIDDSDPHAAMAEVMGHYDSRTAEADSVPVEHDLYRRGDPDVPESILDGNGDVVLSACRRCGRGEIELDEPCVPRPPPAEPKSFVHVVPDHCDRIVWRGRYYTLPLK